jgi:hypothetical protein
MALLDLVYRDQLFPRRACARAFEELLAERGDRQACCTMVGLPGATSRRRGIN